MELNDPEKRLGGPHRRRSLRIIYVVTKRKLPTGGFTRVESDSSLCNSHLGERVSLVLLPHRRSVVNERHGGQRRTRRICCVPGFAASVASK